MKWNNVNYLTLPQQVEKNRKDIIELSNEIKSDLDPKDYRVVEVGQNKKYSSILHAMKENENRILKILVYGGTYNIEQEYLDYYGHNYFVNYTGYLGTTDRFDRGLNLKDGDQIIGIGNVELTFTYTGDNDLVKEWFSLLNTSQNNLVKNLKLTITNNSCRYGIHDDFAYGPGNNVFTGNTFRGTSYLNTFMGCGFGGSNNYLIEDCIFENAGDLNIAYHSSLTTANKCRIIIKDSIGNGNVRFNAIGDSNDVALAIVNNCRFNSITKIQDGIIDNIRLETFENSIISEEVWIVPTLGDGFANLDEDNYMNMGFFKDRLDFVHVRGIIVSSTASGIATITTLPVGYRPLRAGMYTARLGNGTLIRVDVNMDGSIVAYDYVATTYLVLDITYSIV